MNLGLLTAIWGRPKLTELVLAYYANIIFDIRCAVYSDEDTSSGYYGSGWAYIEADNDPLSSKWNRGVLSLKNEPVYDWGGWERKNETEVDAVMIVGSDDLVTPVYIEVVKYLLDKGVDYITLPSLYFYDLQSGRMHFCLAERLGLGRVLSRRLLDLLDWKPWPEGLNSGLDGAMYQRIQELKKEGHEVREFKFPVQLCGKLGIAAMDIKGSDNNIWSYAQAYGSLVGSEQRNPEKVLRKHFPSVADELLNWNNKVYAE